MELPSNTANLQFNYLSEFIPLTEHCASFKTISNNSPVTLDLLTKWFLSKKVLLQAS